MRVEYCILRAQSLLAQRRIINLRDIVCGATGEYNIIFSTARSELTELCSTAAERCQASIMDSRKNEYAALRDTLAAIIGAINMVIKHDDSNVTMSSISRALCEKYLVKLLGDACTHYPSVHKRLADSIGEFETQTNDRRVVKRGAVIALLLYAGIPFVVEAMP